MTGSPITKAPETFYRVEVSDRDGQIVTIEPEMLAGRAIGEPEEKALRAASDSLTGFIGRRSYDSLARELEQAKAALGMSTPWPLHDVLAKLIEAGEHLLTAHNCDKHGHEEYRAAVEQAKLLNEHLRAALKPSNEVGT